MKKKNTINFIITGSLFVLFAIFTLLIKFVDVQAIGPNGSSVGFGTINGWFANLCGVNFDLYTISDWASVLAVLVALGFAILGLFQWIKRKSFNKVDSSLLVLGAFYIVVFGFYLLFEVVAINHRPVLIDGYLEASYPSSTTMLVLCFMPTAMMQLNRLIKNKITRLCINIPILLYTTAMVVLRVISGVHWITDIIGGIILSSALLMAYYSATFFLDSKKAENILKEKNSD